MLARPVSSVVAATTRAKSASTRITIGIILSIDIHRATPGTKLGTALSTTITMIATIATIARAAATTTMYRRFTTSCPSATHTSDNTASLNRLRFSKSGINKLRINS